MLGSGLYHLEFISQARYRVRNEDGKIEQGV
jgi:hypothetical protein